MTIILQVKRKIKEKDLNKVLEILETGGIIAYPTDTCYGLGVDATNEEAITRLRKLKQRSIKQPISIVVDSMETIKKYAVLTPQIEFLIKQFMPGPLTIVANKTELVPDILNIEGISFRIPDNPITLSILSKFKKPVTSPSANPRGLKPSYNVKQVINYFDEKLDLIVDVGELPRIKPSTIIDMRSDHPILIREGPIPFNKIIEELKKFGSVK